jgi:hypothetical protein
MDYTREYFIEKFEKASELYFKRYCALEQCGVATDGAYEPTEESTALIELLGGKNPYDFKSVYSVNDMHYASIDWNPKKNILDRLKSGNV